MGKTVIIMEKKIRHLQSKDIVSYLPYNLKVLSTKWHEPMALVGVQGKLAYIDCLLDEISTIKPILRPMRDLVTEIIVEGYNDNKPFVPLYHLAPIAFKFHKWNERFFLTISEECVTVNISCKNSDSIGIHCHIKLTVSRIDLLNQWHFDYRGLIEQDLAIEY